MERAAKIGVPLLLIFGAFLALRGLTLGTSGASPENHDASAWDGLNFLWTPQFDSLSNPTVWLAAAGQMFFTLSVGMGTVHCYSSYLKEKDDIALNAVSAGFMNELVEVVLGSLIVIPIAAGYLGIDWVKENAGFGMAFQTMPYLFDQWGDIISNVAGVFWFGLLFFAGITSSLAMGTPWMGFMEDEFNFNKKQAALSFGLLILFFGLPTVMVYQVTANGSVDQIFFNEYDYWAGTMSLVVFALAEAILFAWIFGMKKGWPELTSGADIKVPLFFNYVMIYVTPLLLMAVFFGSLFLPEGGDWAMAFEELFNGEGWQLDNGSIIEMLQNKGLYEQIASAKDALQIERLKEKVFYVNAARLLLTSLFAGICILVYIAYLKRKKNNPFIEGV